MIANKRHYGYLLLEMVVAMGFFSLIAISAYPPIAFMQRRFARTRKEIRANFLLQEGMEITYNLLANSWTSVPPGEYHAGKDATDTTWELTSPATPGDPQIITQLNEDYSRIIAVEYACRNPGDNHIWDHPSDIGCPEGGWYLDVDTKIITTTIEWSDDKSSPRSAELLISNIF